MIQKASQNDLQTVYDIVQRTIAEIYPHYYPAGAVEFFRLHHCMEHIAQDITHGRIYLLYQAHAAVGTVTIDGNSINRLFVLPEYQGRGFGTILMDFAEEQAAQGFTEISLDASFSAQEMYLRRGYLTGSFEKIPCSQGDYLCYFIMKKQLR